MNTGTITVNYDGMEPIKAERVRIGAFADKELPSVGMAIKPETSRFLDALEKKYKDVFCQDFFRMMEDVLSFGEHGKSGSGDV